MAFDSNVRIGEVRVLADTREPLSVLVVENRGLAGWLVVPVSPYRVPANDREIVLASRTFQLWNVCPVSRRVVERSWVVDMLADSEIESVRDALSELKGLPPMRFGDYERRHLVPGGDLRSWSARCPAAKILPWRAWCAWSAAASVVIGLGVAWLLAREDDVETEDRRVLTVRLEKPAAVQPLVAVVEEKPADPIPESPVSIEVPSAEAPAVARLEPEPVVAKPLTATQLSKDVPVVTVPPVPDDVVVGRRNAGEREDEVMGILRELMSVQRADGSWGKRPLRDTALVVLALMAHGETSGSAEFGSSLTRGVRYLSEASLAGQSRTDVQVVACALCCANVATRNPNVRIAAEEALASIGDNRSVEAGRDWSGILADLEFAADGSVTAERGFDAASAPPLDDRIESLCALVLRLLKK